MICQDGTRWAKLTDILIEAFYVHCTDTCGAWISLRNVPVRRTGSVKPRESTEDLTEQRKMIRDAESRTRQRIVQQNTATAAPANNEETLSRYLSLPFIVVSIRLPISRQCSSAVRQCQSQLVFSKVDWQFNENHNTLPERMIFSVLIESHIKYDGYKISFFVDSLLLSDSKHLNTNNI